VKNKYEELAQILNKEVKPALGCTGPTAISYAVSVAKDIVGGNPKSVRVILDRDMCAKNDDVGIPGTSEKGLDMAAALGAICGDSTAGLEVLRNVTAKDEIYARDFAKKSVRIEPDWDYNPIGLYIEAIVETDKGVGRAIVAKTHTNVVLKERDGEVIFKVDDFNREYTHDEEKDLIRKYKIRDFYEFAVNVPFESIAFLKQAIELNKKLAEAGLKSEKGPGFGKAFSKIKDDSAIVKAKALTSAAAEARMVGEGLAAMSCATSGNVGITGSLPLVAIAEAYDKTEEELIRALSLSYLITILGKNYIGRLSSMCSCCVSASVGVAAGTVFLLGGSYQQVEAAIQSTIASVFGVVCDGARIACAYKLASAIGIAIDAAYLAMENVGVPYNQGVIGKTADDSMAFMGQIARSGMVETDKALCKAMYERSHPDVLV
jgi:L-cysteine desulfidase